MSEQTGTNELLVIADSPIEMVRAQRELVANVRAKEAALQAEIDATAGSMEDAMRANINPDPFKAIISRQDARVRFLGKIAEALEAGFVLVPNMDSNSRTIAIRIKNGRAPRGSGVKTSYRRQANVNPEAGDILPAGEGHYVDPRPTQKVETIQEKGYQDKLETKYVATPQEFSDEMDIPLEFIKPEVMSRLSAAMHRRIFDEISLAPSFVTAKDDPMVLGRIIDRKNKRTVTFLFAWFVDTAAI